MNSVTVTGAWVTDSTPILIDPDARRQPADQVARGRLRPADRRHVELEPDADVSVAPAPRILTGTRDAPLDGVRYLTADYRVSGLAARSIVVIAGNSDAPRPRIPRDPRPERRRHCLRPDRARGWRQATCSGAPAGPVEPERPAGPDRQSPPGGGHGVPARPAGDLHRHRARHRGAGDAGAADRDSRRGQADDALRHGAGDRSLPARRRNFTYSTDVTNVDCGGRGVVDCFVFSRRGTASTTPRRW